MIAVIKNIRIFVVFKTKNKTYSQLVLAIFFVTCLTAIICKDKKAIKSVLDCYTNVSNLFLVEHGGDSLSYITQISSVMTKNSEICEGVKHSNTHATYSTRNVEKILSTYSQTVNFPVSAASVELLKLLLVKELVAKSNAYAFIKSQGLLSEFMGFKTKK